MKRYLLILICTIVWVPVIAQERYAGGLAFDDEAYEKTAKTEPLSRDVTVARLPNRVSLKAFAPTPGNQAQYNNCVGWSSSYAARSIIYNKAKKVTQTDQVNANAFSPAFTYRIISNDNSCDIPTSIEHALRSMKDKGTVPKSAFDYNCPGAIPSHLYATAKKYRISDYSRLFFLKDTEKLKLLTVKNALSQGNPVIIGMKCTPSFEKADGQEVWNRTEDIDTKVFFGHAMCIVGYDNKKYGGAFEIMNSWGERWGKGGFIWVRYKDFVQFVKYAYLPKGNRENSPIASSQKPKTKNPPRPKKTANANSTSRPANNSQQSRPRPQATPSSQFGGMSSELLDLAGEVNLIMANGEAMPARLYGNVYRTKNRYPAGTKFRIHVSSVKDAYIYVIGSDTDYKTTPLFPNAKAQNAKVNAGSAPLSIPNNRSYIQLDASSSLKDYLCVIYSEKALNLSLIRRKIEAAQGSFPARLQSAIGQQLISAKNLQYENGRIAFSAMKGPGFVSTLIIETRRE